MLQWSFELNWNSLSEYECEITIEDIQRISLPK
jgi:hypothetical protein